jgi:aspartyl protease family protein
MRNLMIFAALLIGAGTYMAQVADKMTVTAAARATTPAQQATFEDNAQAGRRSVSIARDGRGHFQTEARIDGQRVGFMVDTGASVIALNESSAARIGVRPSQNDYDATVTTANGKVKAARTRLAMVDVGGPLYGMSTPWCCPTRRCRKTCLACRFYPNSGASNSPTDAWCWNNKAGAAVDRDCRRRAPLWRCELCRNCLSQTRSHISGSHGIQGCILFLMFLPLS